MDEGCTVSEDVNEDAGKEADAVVHNKLQHILKKSNSYKGLNVYNRLY